MIRRSRLSGHNSSTHRYSLLPLKLEGLGVGSAVECHAAAPWRAWQSVIPTLMATTQSPDTDTLFTPAPRLRAQTRSTQTTLSLQMNKPAFLRSLGSALRQNATQKSLTTSPVDRAVLLFQSAPHTGAHLMQPSSEACEAEDRCVRVALAERLLLPHPAVADPSEWY